MTSSLPLMGIQEVSAPTESGSTSASVASKKASLTSSFWRTWETCAYTPPHTTESSGNPCPPDPSGREPSTKASSSRISAGFFKYSWLFEPQETDQIYFFCFTVPYPYNEVIRSIDFFQAGAPNSAYFYREVLTYSLDHREVELLTISSIENFSS